MSPGAMSGRQRLFAALCGEETDRVPIWLLFPYDPIGCYVDVRRHPAYRPVVAAAEEKAITLNRRNLSAPLFTEAVREETHSGRDGEWAVKRTQLSWRGRSLTGETRRRNDAVEVRKPLVEDEDLEFYCSLPVETDRERLTAALEAQLAERRAEQEAFPRHLGAMMFCLGEPIGPVYRQSCLESYAIWSLTHSDLIEGFLDRLQERLRIIYTWALEHDLADVYFLVGSELASPPLVSRGTFQRWVVPYAQELIALVHEYGKLAIQHYHGAISEILPDFPAMGADGLHTIEAPPVGDCPLEAAFDTVGQRLTLIGNIQYDQFRSLDRHGMEAAVEEVLRDAEGQRFILSPTAGPFDPDVPPQVIENYLTFIETAWHWRS